MKTLDELHDIDFEFMEIRTARKNNNTVYYYNIPNSYDIETASFRDINDQPVAITYSHALNINGDVFHFRTWEEMKEALNIISERAGLNALNRMIVYIHNFGYEFEFMKHHFQWVKSGFLFNGGEHKIITALTQTGIEFRCSMMLSGASLEVTAKNLTMYPIKKLVGDLNHNQIRTPLTKLKPRELEYILNDVLIIEYFIREAMYEENDITKLPFTNTGYVRNFCRNNTIAGNDKGRNRAKKRYRQLMRDLTLEPLEAAALRSAFAGGYTHGNVMKIGRVYFKVTAKDIISSYPGRMLAYQFPMSKGELYNCDDKGDFYDQLDAYCCLFYVTFEGITRKANDAYISVSKCLSVDNVTNNNGRVDAADSITMWITDVDFESIQLSYEIDDFSIGTMYRYKRGYLPTELTEAVIKFFNEKTTLKDLEDKVSEYLKSKGMLNSTYGMIVMDIIRDLYEWSPNTNKAEKFKPNEEEAIEKNNTSRKRFLFYPWGVWITAYARYEVFKVIVELGDDYIYCDTDSIYFTNGEKHQHLFDSENVRILELLFKACDHHGWSYDILSPMDQKGKRHTIGLWSHDGDYTRFKTLGAKRYMTEKLVTKRKGKNGKHKTNKKIKVISITVAGVNKAYAVPYLLRTYKEGIFEAFDRDLHVPAGHCGKLTHTYIPHESRGVIRDYMGQPYEYHELSGIHLEQTKYSFSISNEFADYFEFLQNNAPGL